MNRGGIMSNCKCGRPVDATLCSNCDATMCSDCCIEDAMSKVNKNE
jgi:hypothetical protein